MRYRCSLASSSRPLIEEQVPDLWVLDVVLPCIFDREREAFLDGGSRLQLLQPALHMRELRGVLALALPSRGPADGRHVGNRIFLAGQIRMLGKPFVHHSVETIAFIGVAI